MMDEIINNLAEISELRVPSRTTMEKYRETKLSTSEIANEVGVAYLLEGSVQKLGNQVKVIAQLINAGKDDHVWQETYTEDIGDIKLVFEIQSNIATTIAKQIGANIKSNEGEQIEAIHTNSLLAYDYYFQAKEMRYASDQSLDDINSAIELYIQAVALDSSFALAWVGLAESNRWLYWSHIRHYRGDKDEHFARVQEQIHKTKNYLDKAIDLAPDLKEVRLEEGAYYYLCERNYTKALQILEKLSMDYPNDAETLFWISLVLRRKGEFERSFEYINKAISLNSSHWNYWREAGFTLWIQRKYDEAEKYYKKASTFHPTPDWFNNALLVFYLNQAENKKAMQYLNKHAQLLPEIEVTFWKSWIHLNEGNFKQLVNGLETITSDTANLAFNSLKYLWLAFAYDKLLNEKKASENYNKVKELAELNINNVEIRAEFYLIYAQALAGLGMKEQAIDAIDKGFEILHYSEEDALDGFDIYYDKVTALVMLGEYHEAIETIKHILNHYGGLLTIKALRNFPLWEPLRDMEEFKAIINNPEYQPR